MQHLNPETPFNLRCREAEPFWIVGFHNCQAASTPPLPPENRESWEFNYDGILALDPAGLRRCLMGEPSFRTKRHPVFTQELRTPPSLHYVQFALHQTHVHTQSFDFLWSEDSLMMVAPALKSRSVPVNHEGQQQMLLK